MVNEKQKNGGQACLLSLWDADFLRLLRWVI